MVRDAMTMQVPQLVSSQMTKALSALSTERMHAMNGIDSMRMSTLNFVMQERTAIVEEIDRQRVATIEQVTDERKAALQEIGAIARESTGSALSAGKELIDRLVWRLGVLAAAFGIFIALTGGVLLTIIRSKSVSRREHV